MRRALELAQGQPRAPFGAVIVNITTQPPMIVAEGVNAAGNDPTKHGEVKHELRAKEGQEERTHREMERDGRKGECERPM